MATSGTVASVTFTPEFTGQLTVTAKFDSASSTADGGRARAKIFVTQSSVTTYGTVRDIPDADALVWRYIFTISSLDEIECGVYGFVGGGPASETFENITITAALAATP